MPLNSLCDSFIFDLADIVRWSPPPDAAIPADTIRRMMHSAPFLDYERGRLAEDELYTLLGSHLSLSASDIARVFRLGRANWQVNVLALDRIRELRRIPPGARVYGAWNVSPPDWTYLRKTFCLEPLAEFEMVFTSADAGERMPSAAFYLRFLELTGEDVSRAAFLSTTVDHVIAATSLGMTGIHWQLEETVKLERTIRALTRNAVADGEQYLRDHAGQMWSTTDTGVEVKDNFTQLLILEVTGNPHLVNLPPLKSRTYFFADSPVLTTADYPDDVDTTSIACTVRGECYSQDMKNAILDDILTNRNEENITLMYFDPSRPRIDHVVCVNVLTFFHVNGRVAELPEMLDWVVTILRTRAYTWGTRYYLGADIFLYFFSRLLAVPSPLPHHADVSALFKACVAERLGEPGDAPALSMRVLAAISVNVLDRRDYDRLLTMQDADGAWPTGWIYKYGVSGVLIGNRGLTTAMAVAAIRGFRKLHEGR